MTHTTPAPLGPLAAELRNVSLSRSGRRILDSVDLGVRAGELVALIGPNGAGKSTVLSVLAGDSPPEQGVALLAGRDTYRIKTGELSRMRAVLLQEKTVSFSYPVRDVVMMGRTPWARTPESRFDDDSVADALSTTETTHLADRDVTTLSGGERARVCLARVLAQRCPFILLDEPTDALDLGHQEQVLALTRGLAHNGTAVLTVLHDLNLAAAYADRIVLLNDGRVVADGDAQTVLDQQLLSEVYKHPVDVVPHPRTGRPLVLPIAQVEARRSDR